MLRRVIGSTGAEEVRWSTQTSVLEQSTSNAPVLWFWTVGSTGAEEKLESTKHALWNKRLSLHRWFDFWASVQPVLKRGCNPSKHALWNKGLSLHRCFDFLTIGSTGALLDFCLYPEKIDRQGVGPSAMHRMLRCLGTGSTGAADFLCFQLFWLGFECDFDCCFFQELCWLLLTILCYFWVSV